MQTDLIQIALTGLALLGSIGIFFGIGLAIAAHKFAVEKNPKVEEVMEVLPQAQCGGCGYAGCEGYARAVVENPDVPPNLCFPGKEAVGNKVAKITGKEMAKRENSIARLRCDRQDGHVSHKHYYIGFDSCAAANLAYGGPSKCQYACIGMGDCARACPFKAIEMRDGMPFIHADLCVGCGKCESHCPQSIPIREKLKEADRALRPLPYRIGINIARAFMVRKGRGKKNGQARPEEAQD